MAQFEDFEELKGHMVRLEPADADEARLEMLDEDDLAAFGKAPPRAVRRGGGSYP